MVRLHALGAPKWFTPPDRKLTRPASQASLLFSMCGSREQKPLEERGEPSGESVIQDGESYRPSRNLAREMIDEEVRAAAATALRFAGRLGCFWDPRWAAQPSCAAPGRPWS